MRKLVISKVIVHPERAIRVITLMAFLIAGAIFLSGCRHLGLDDITAVELSDPVKRHPISYARHREEMYVELPHRGRHLSSHQHADVWRFVNQYKSESNGPLVVSSPASAGGHLASSGAVDHVLAITREAGLPDEAIRISRHYNLKGEIGPAIALSYSRPVAVPPHCGYWPKDIGNRNKERLPFQNFGCATQRNLALNVANARDLQFPQEETPRSSERRSAKWTDYISGGNSSSANEGSGDAVGTGGTSTTKSN